jgi:hypothetical protein
VWTNIGCLSDSIQQGYFGPWISLRTLNQASNFSLLEKLPSPEWPGNTAQKNFFAVSCMCHKTNVGGRRHMLVLKHGNLIPQKTVGRIECMDMAEDCKAQGARTF